MRRHDFVRLFCITTLVLVLLAVASPTLALQSGAGLFRDAAKKAALDQRNEQAVVRARYVDLNLDVLPGARAPAAAGSTVLLNLFDDRSFTGVLDHVEYKPNGLIWVGSLQGIELSTVNIVTEDNVMVGSINYPGGVYVIRYAGNGVHAVLEVDQSKYPPESSATPSGPAIPDTYSPAPGAPADSAGTIDVMVVYTPAFAAYAGGASAANALVDLGVSQANTSYANSGITQRVNLVYKGQVTYTEPGTGALTDWDTALNDVTFGTGGLSGVGTLRNTYGADVVSLFTYWSSTGYCGLGWFMNSVSSTFASHAFDVVNGDCIAGNDSYAHEMGHNMGADHDWYVSDTTTPYTYSHGRVNLTAAWRTVMSYNNLCTAVLGSPGCTRIRYWSNPNLTYGGASLGIAGGTNSNPAICYNNVANPSCDADNHLVLNNTAYTVANFRQHTTPPPPPPPGTIKVRLPLLMKSAAAPSGGISGNLKHAGAPASGVALKLRFYNGSTYSTAATTTTDASGNYRFNGVAALGSGQSYYVRYDNPGSDTSRLWFWGSRNITSFASGSSVDLGSSDLANISLSSPAPAATVPVPVTFQWVRRTATPTDSYYVRAYDYTDMNPYVTTNLLGYVSSVYVTNITGLLTYTQYAWDVAVHDVNQGDGSSYYARAITFTSLGADLAAPFDMAARAAQPRDEVLRPPQRER